MPPKRRETKAITIRLTDDEYKKIQSLAEIRHMNPTEYTRNVALGNRIKPTIINYENENSKPKNEISQTENENKNNLFGEKSDGEQKNIDQIENSFFKTKEEKKDPFAHLNLNFIMDDSEE